MPKSLSGKRVLVVDDNKAVVEVLSAFLSVLGHDHDVARDGERALAVLCEGVFDLVLMDCRLPDCDGSEVTRRFRLLEGGRARTPIVGITADPGSVETRRCLEAGMDGVLPKPFSMRQLDEVLLRWLNLTTAP